MVIIFTERYKIEFEEVFNFIANDSLNRAEDFRYSLLDKIKIIEDSPCAFRKSLKFNDDNVRDFIFKGYVVPY